MAKLRNGIRYVYFMRPSLRSHVNLYQVWVETAREHGLPIGMLTVLSLRTVFQQWRLFKEYRQLEYFKILVAPEYFSGKFLTAIYFLWLLLWNEKVVVHLKKQEPALFEKLQSIFGKRLRFVIELEGDFQSEAEYLRSHPYKPGFYDDFIRGAEAREAAMAERLARADHVFVVAPALRDLLVARYPDLDLAAKFSVVPTGVDCKLRYYSNDLRRDMRERLGWKEKSVLIYIGNAHYSWQNVYRTIEVFKLIKDKLSPKAHLALLVRAVDHGIVSEFLEQQKIPDADYQLKEVAPGDITLYLNAADLGVLLRHEHPMNKASAPGKFGEYVACGLPVLMTRGIGTFSSRIQEGAFGAILDDMDDDEEVLTKVQPLLSHDSERRMRIRRWAESELSTNANIRSYIDVLCKLSNAAEVDSMHKSRE